MGTPRSTRRQSKICYKEDDSFEDFVETPTRLSSRITAIKSMSTTVGKSPQTQITPVSRENWRSDNLKSLPKINERSWNPALVLTDIAFDKGDSDSNAPVTPNESKSLRRGTRMRHKTSLAIDFDKSQKVLKHSSSSSDSDDTNNGHIIKIPTSLFADDDIEGKTLFGFKTSHRKKDMARKAIEAAMDSPRDPTHLKDITKSCLTLKTPRSAIKKYSVTSTGKRGRKSEIGTPKSEKKLIAIEKTPHHLRKQIQRRLKTMLSDGENSEDEDPFSESDSDYCPSDHSYSIDKKDITDADENSHSNSSSSEDDNKPLRKPAQDIAEPKDTTGRLYALRRTRGDKEINYIVKSDNYFSMHGSKKVVTSNHTLERLKTPRLTEDKLQSILKNQKISKEHQTAMKELIEDHQRLYDKWIYLLSEGFSILLHGVGTKQKLIEDFQTKKLSKYPCIVINGFFPSLTIKDILESIMLDLLEMKKVPTNLFEAVKIIDDEMHSMPNLHVFILVHNIDGALLRNNKTQSILSQLAKIKNIHIVASIDYINAPLLWDHAKLSNYNFSWRDVTTLLPYQQETAFESSLMVHKSSALAFSSLKNVFQSLTTNARGIFMIIVNNQLKNKKQPHYQGIAFKDLYWSAREAFLVSSDLALRAQLTEFLDHKLVKNRRTAEGIENLIIPIDNVLLEQFIDQIE